MHKYQYFNMYSELVTMMGPFIRGVLVFVGYYKSGLNAR